MKKRYRLLCLTAALMVSLFQYGNPAYAWGEEPDYIVVIPGETRPPAANASPITPTQPTAVMPTTPSSTTLVPTTPFVPTTPVTPTMPVKGTGFTEDGILSTRDLLFDKATNKQYIVVETRNGQTFYMVIDYDKPLDEDEERYQTYFLNPVDEADLLALVEQEETQPIVCNCVEKCVLGNVNEDCELCRQNVRRCVGKAVETKPPETEPVAQPEQKGSPAGVLTLLLLLGVGAGFGYYLYVKKKSEEQKKGSTDLSEYDFGMDEEDDLEEEEDSEESEELDQ